LTISLYNQTHLLFSLHIGSKDLCIIIHNPAQFVK